MILWHYGKRHSPFTMIVKSSRRFVWSSSVDITPAWCWRRARGWSSPCRRWRGRRCWGRSPPAPPRTAPATAATPCASSSGRRAALQSGSRKHCNGSSKCRYRAISWPKLKIDNAFFRHFTSHFNFLNFFKYTQILHFGWVLADKLAKHQVKTVLWDTLYNWLWCK